ncbi:MAG: tRNA (adenosine(37)-N6)-threonylcarbamoyltransferase complex dimerization subunit type 1 TsaB [Chloroflexota bacterium]|nr:MAG: tRNA (adenosine(37)-N6)-threonylcarbamoyltransferase complex dimerization subunit type 1 TsaB [Chloroflexota bacterium]UCF28572.1 MAG: tRNA (adenosine(37)-N6)-threonylcarbamoyltransferase complex dimerization subunit type 1 TsaB [Chloroflexota bacterium]
MLLAIDTSTRTVGVALYDGVQVVSEKIWLSGQFHTVELAPTVSEVIDQAGISMDELKVVAVAIGPGSFTGLRIGMSLAKGMALAGRMAIVGIPSLDILAASQPIDDKPLAAILQAGRGRIAVGWYKNYSGEWKADKKVQVMTPRDLTSRIKSPTIVCGELSEDERRLFRRKRINVILASPAQSLRRPSFLAELGWHRWQRGMSDDPAALAPEYLHYDQQNSG